jgi:Fibronectin type III domain
MAVPRTQLFSTLLRVREQRHEATSVTLTWVAPSSNGGAKVDKYLVQRYTTASGVWKSIATPTLNGYTAGGLTHSTRYYFRIFAHNAAGWSPASTTVNAVPYTTPSAPSSCTVDQWGGPGSHTMVVQWQASPSDGGSPAVLYEVEATASGYYHKEPHAGAGYAVWQAPYGWFEVRVWAVNAAGAGPSCTTAVMMWWP